MTSVGGVATVIGLSEFNAVIGQYATDGQVGPSRLAVGGVIIEMPSREQLTAQKRFPHRSKFYPSQSAKTLLKNFSE